MALAEGYSDRIEAVGCRDQYGESQVRLTCRWSLSYQTKGVVLWWFYLDHLQMLPQNQHQAPLQPRFPK